MQRKWNFIQDGNNIPHRISHQEHIFPMQPYRTRHTKIFVRTGSRPLSCVEQQPPITPTHITEHKLTCQQLPEDYSLVPLPLTTVTIPPLQHQYQFKNISTATSNTATAIVTIIVHVNTLNNDVLFNGKLIHHDMQCLIQEEPLQQECISHKSTTSAEALGLYGTVTHIPHLHIDNLEQTTAIIYTSKSLMTGLQNFMSGSQSVTKCLTPDWDVFLALSKILKPLKEVKYQLLHGTEKDTNIADEFRTPNTTLHGGGQHQ
jgi:hypothetical protein